MLASLMIVFREAIEAGPIVGIVLGVTRGVPHRGLQVAGGVASGLPGGSGAPAAKSRPPRRLSAHFQAWIEKKPPFLTRIMAASHGGPYSVQFLRETDMVSASRRQPEAPRERCAQNNSTAPGK